jgi:Phytanoyl-CoA dioxygenase (PhyH)
MVLFDAHEDGMDDWFNSIAAETYLDPSTVRDLRLEGFVVIPGPVPESLLPELARVYDQAVLLADAADVGRGSTTTRVNDFVNRSTAFDALYLHPPLLEACCRVIAQPFKLSSMLARTLNPRTPSQNLHVDFSRDEQGWPMLGFIFMVDEFRADNGATCFLPRSQGARELPTASGIVQACGPAGSMILYNGSIWHGHGANRTRRPRRSIQGAYIRRTLESSGTLRCRTRTLERIGTLAKYLLAW